MCWILRIKTGPVFGAIGDIRRLAGESISNENHRNYHSQFVNVQTDSYAFDHPHASILVPIKRNFATQGVSDAVAMLLAIVPFDRFAENLLPPGAPSIYMVLQNSCGQSHTYLLGGNSVRTLLSF